MRAPEPLTIKEDANHNLGFCWTSPEYPAGTSLDFGIWWWYNSWGTIYEGYEFGAIMTELGNGVYQIGFEAAGDDMDYNELVIIVEKEEVIEPPALSVLLYPEEITTGESSAIYITFDEAYWCSIPPEIKANVEIIKGTEYGNLFNYFTGEKGKIFTNLDFFYGQYLFVHFIAEGIAAEETDTIIFRVSTTDPEIVPKETILIIKPPPIYVYTVPEVLGADDTANVIIKHRLEDGTLEDFPPEQTFELAVLDGCVNGNFLVNGVIDVYFADAVQPIKFVTADSLDPEYDKVLVRVGANLWGYNRPVGGESTEKEEQRAGIDNLQIVTKGKTLKERREKFEQMITEKKAEAEAKKKKEGGNEPLAPVVPQCALDNPSYYFNSYANVLMEVGCNNPEWLCSSSQSDVPDFGIQILDNPKDEVDICKLQDKNGNYYIGKFHLLYDTELYDFNIETCYNENENRWHFSAKDNKVNIRAILGTCLENMDDNAVKIFNFNDLYSKIPQDEVEKALRDFNSQHRYPPGGVFVGKYWIIEWMLPHEDLHRQDYQREAVDVVAKDFGKSFKDMWKPTCDDFRSIFHSNLNELMQQGENQYIGILKGKDKDDKESFTSVVKKKYSDFINKESYYWEWKDIYGRTLWIITPYYEDFAQIRLWNTIEKYIQELSKRMEE